MNDAGDNRLAAFVIVLAVVLGPMGCSDDPGPENPENPVDPRPPPAWVDDGEVVIKDAKSPTVQITLPAGPLRYVAIRVLPRYDGGFGATGPGTPTVCYQLDKVGPVDGGRWVDNSRSHRDWGPACRKCSQRVAAQRGYGGFVLPNDGNALPATGTLRLRVVLRDCKTGVSAEAAWNPDLPPRVQVEHVTEPAQATGTTGQLRARILLADGAVLVDGALPKRWQAVVKAAAAHLAGAGVQLKIEKVAQTPALTKPLQHGNAIDDATDEALAKAREALEVEGGKDGGRWIPIVIAPCLRKGGAGTDALLGGSKRTPGGLADAERAPLDAVVIAEGLCGEAKVPLSTDELGVLVAHELGHYLGLHHSDGPYADHRRKPKKANLMHSGAVGLTGQAPTFSAAQADALRRHPVIFFPASY